MKFFKLVPIISLTTLLLVGCGVGVGQEVNKAQQEDVKNVSVVSATVSATNVLEKLDAEVIGIPTTKMEIPEKYKELPQVGQAMNPDLEIIASLEPDVLVVDDTFRKNIEESLKSYDLNTFYFQSKTYNSFIQSITDLGKELGKEEEATKLITELKKVEEEARTNKGDKEPTIAIMFGSGENFMLATESSYLGDLVKTVGGKNITNELDVKDNGFGYAQFSLEQIMKQNPDYILRFAHGNIEDTKAMFDKAFDQNPAYKELDAVKNKKVYDLDSEIFNVSANLGVTEAIKTLGDMLYGE